MPRMRTTNHPAPITVRNAFYQTELRYGRDQ